jgi:hypothetical protein
MHDNNLPAAPEFVNESVRESGPLQSARPGVETRPQDRPPAHHPEGRRVLPFAVFATFLLLATGFLVAGSRALDSANRRELGGRNTFLARFDGTGIPADLLVQAYETLSRRVSAEVRDIRPGDRLVENFGMTAADMEDVALLVAARCEARIPSAHELDELDARVRTVDDLVRFLVQFYEPSRVARAASA